MRNKFYEHYKDRCNARYQRYIQRQYGPFITEIMATLIELDNKIERDLHIAELGCGIGSISIALSKAQTKIDADFYCYYTLMDINRYILGLCWQNLFEKGVTQSNFDLVKHDVTRPYVFKQFDVVHSHGVLEHLSDEDILKVLDNYEQCVQFHYIPSDKYKTLTIGDERLLSKEYWKELTGMEVVAFNNEHDLIITNRKDFDFGRVKSTKK